MAKPKKGKVVSKSGAQTIVVKVDRLKKHSRYHKRFIVSKKYHVHDPKQYYKPGDAVQFTDSKPYSKLKKWRVVEKK